MKTLLTSLLIIVGLTSIAFAQTKKLPKHILPIAHDNIEYRVPHMTSQAEGMKHNGGYIEMINKKTGARIALIEIYDNPKGAPPVYIKSIKIEDTNLVVEDENGKSYTLSIAKEGAQKSE